MQVRLRLQRAGKSAKGRANYRIVAISRTKAKQARHLDIIGYYDPVKKPAVIKVNREKLDRWIKKGAQMSETVKHIVKKKG